jgi:dedicated sortase system histidine kinase
VSIRLQLLLVALTTLVLPWAGCQYARELEGALRTAQEQALLASAGTVANALSAEPQRVFRGAEEQEPFDAGRGDIYVYALGNQPLLDGYREDWNVTAEPGALPARGGPAARLLAGLTDRYLFLYIEVDDPHFDPEPGTVHPEQDRFDRVDLTFERADSTRETYFLATTAPGMIQAQSLVRNEAGEIRAVAEPRIQAYWLQTPAGYHVEARVPRSLVGDRLWIDPIDAGASPAAGESVLARSGGRLFFGPSGLGDLLATFVRAGTRATVVDRNGLKLGSAGGVEEAGSEDVSDVDKDRASAAIDRAWFRRFMAADTTQLPLEAPAADRLNGTAVAGALAGRPSAEWLRSARRGDALLIAAAPIMEGKVARGAVVLEQPGDQLVGLRDRALAHLFNLTLLATAVAVVFVFVFATWISVRLGRLGAAADAAVGADGRIRLEIPESARADEIGALARSFERLLGRLNEHAQYLRTLGGKLSHELRTPLTIVRSSLDNLESEGVRDDQRPYLTRAREGTQRLQSILSALGAAARVEESIKQAERVHFDLRELLIGAAAAYRDGFPSAHIELETPEGACPLRGAPELIVQMLDKLIENAVDYCPAGGGITLRLARIPGSYVIEVGNDGPSIPDAMLGSLFESLFEQRAGRDDKPHFGLGLYIVKLIAEFHGGTATAANRADAGGAVFTVVLPVI